MTRLQQAKKAVQSSRGKGSSTRRLPGPIRVREEAEQVESATQCAGRYARYPKKA